MEKPSSHGQTLRKTATVRDISEDHLWYFKSNWEHSKWGYKGREKPTMPFHVIFFPGRAYAFWTLLKNCFLAQLLNFL